MAKYFLTLAIVVICLFLDGSDQTSRHHSSISNLISRQVLDDNTFNGKNTKLTPNLWNVLKLNTRENSANRDRRLHEFVVDEDIIDDASEDLTSEDELPPAPPADAHEERSAGYKCPKCSNSTPNYQRISEAELTELRIEYVKRQILEKLRLKDKPKVSATGLPKPIYDGATIQHDERSKTKDLDDYYARTSKKFIFMEQEKYECKRYNPSPSICFSFKINDVDMDGIDVNTAVLWIFKRRSPKDGLKDNIIVSEMERQENPRYLPKLKPIAMRPSDVQEGWIKIDIEWPIKRWFGNHDASHVIHISCDSCDMDFISTEKDYRPFIMIDTQNRRRPSRQKRSVNCTAGVTECCREKLYISFEEIGWGDWIIQPRGYDAYFCRGSCSSAASIAQTFTHHSSFLRKEILSRDSNGKKPLELIPCCTAKQFSSLQLFFRDSNNTATLKTFPNMVIESCGCV